VPGLCAYAAQGMSFLGPRRSRRPACVPPVIIERWFRDLTGGVALAAAAGVWRLRRHGADVPVFMDAVAPALLVAQGIGRIGN